MRHVKEKPVEYLFTECPFRLHTTQDFLQQVGGRIAITARHGGKRDEMTAEESALSLNLNMVFLF